MARANQPPLPPSDMLTQLSSVLEVAGGLVTQLASDGILERLLDAFNQMPAGDREVIVGVIEREVQARRLSQAADQATGHALHPNPNARVYLRSHESVIPRTPLDRDDFMIAMLRAMRATPILRVPDIHAQWAEGAREALEHLEADTRDLVAQLLREALAIVEEAIASAPIPAPAKADAG